MADIELTALTPDELRRAEVELAIKKVWGAIAASGYTDVYRHLSVILAEMNKAQADANQELRRLNTLVSQMSMVVDAVRGWMLRAYTAQDVKDAYRAYLKERGPR